jgi:antirestriction protein ArdC
VIEEMEKGNLPPWCKPWREFPQIAPMNATTNKPYRGINFFILSFIGQMRGYKDPVYMTLKQAKERGGKVKKGAKGLPIVFFSRMEKEKANGKTEKFGFLKRYSVFHISDIEGISVTIPEPPPLEDHNPIQAAEDIVNNMQKAPTIIRDQLCNAAYYAPQLDRVVTPLLGQFESREKYYSVLFHELIHATGHESRLNRKVVGFDQDPKSYAKEELIAEMGASFLCFQVKILPKTIENSAAYLKHWIGKLKEDKRLLFQAASAAQKAADFILGEQVYSSGVTIKAPEEDKLPSRPTIIGEPPSASSPEEEQEKSEMVEAVPEPGKMWEELEKPQPSPAPNLAALLNRERAELRRMQGADLASRMAENDEEERKRQEVEGIPLTQLMEKSRKEREEKEERRKAVVAEKVKRAKEILANPPQPQQPEPAPRSKESESFNLF